MCFSSTTSKVIEQDSTVSITSDQLKYANLIFIEHKKLLKENELLNQQIHNYEVKTNYLQQKDSLRAKQIGIIKSNYAIQIEELNKSIKKKNRTITYWQIGGITVSVGLILLLLLK